MAQITRKFAGGTVQSVIVAQDYELSTMGAPENPETLLKLVHTAGVVVTVLGYYYWSGATWTLIGNSAPQQAQLTTSPSGGVVIAGSANTFYGITANVTPSDSTQVTSAANRTVLQGMLDAGIEVILPPGTTYIDKVLTVPTGAHITGPKSARLELVSGPNNAGVAATSITSVGTLATILFPSAHGLTIGKSRRMIVAGCTPAGYNGLWDVTPTDATHATYNLVASVSNVAASATTGSGLWVGGPYEEYGYCGNVIRNKNWASARHTLSSFTVGSQVQVGSTPVTFAVSGTTDWVAGDYIRVEGDTTRAWNGIFKVAAFAAGVVTLSYKGPSTRVPIPVGTLTAQKADAHIRISNITVSGGSDRLSADPSWESHAILLNNVLNPRLDEIYMASCGKYAIALSNTVEATGDVYFDTTSDGFHLNGGNVNISVRGLRGNSADDFLALTANDPAGQYPFNRYPVNEGYTFADGTSIGYIVQDGGLNGAIFRDIQPQNQNARILISGSSTADVSGIVIDGYQPKFNNMDASQAEINGGRDTGAICICAEPYNATTTRIDDVTIRDWRVGGGKIGPQLVFYDVQVGGPYTGQLVIDKLTLSNITTQRSLPLTNVGSTAQNCFIEMSGVQTRWSIGLLVIENSDINIDATGVDYWFMDMSPSNANGEYVNKILFRNCRFSGVSGNWGAIIAKIGGAGGANTGKFKSIVFDRCTFEFELAAGGHMYPAYVSPSSALSYKPKIAFLGCHFIRTTCAAAVTQNATIILSDNYFDTIESGAIIMATNAASVIDVLWANNYTNGQAILSLTAGATINLLKGDDTFAYDLSKISVSGSKGSVMKSLSTTGGTIVDGNLAVSDGVNWRQVSDTTKFL